MMAAFPCAFGDCGMGPNNDVHKNKRRYGYHPYQAPPTKAYQPTLAERIEELERRLNELEEKVEQPDWRQRR